MTKARPEEPATGGPTTKEPQDLRVWLGVIAVALVLAGSHLVFSPDPTIDRGVLGIAAAAMGFAGVLKACGVNFGELLN